MRDNNWWWSFDVRWRRGMAWAMVAPERAMDDNDDLKKKKMMIKRKNKTAEP